MKQVSTSVIFLTSIISFVSNIVAITGFLLCFVSNHAISQREWGINDSTVYILNQDTTLIASRHILYVQSNSNGGQTAIRDFFDPSVSDYYIRDFDILESQKWYVLVGSRYFGYPTYLYFTQDAGQSWEIDSSYMELAEQNSINQVQIDEDARIYLFEGYYSSRVLYSDDKGENWTMWFESLPAHYFGLFDCPDKSYIYGFEGDGFNSFMFEVPSWLNQETYVLNFDSGCVGQINPDCEYALSGITRLEAISLFADRVNELCMFDTTPTEELSDPNGPILFPNPANSVTYLNSYFTERDFAIRLVDAYGNSFKVIREGNQLDLSFLPKGMYYLILTQSKELYTHRIVKL